MNAKQLLTVIGQAQDDYIAAAIQTRGGAPRKSHLSLKRTLLIAAIIAMMLMLVGCAVVYVLRLQEMKIAETTVTQRFNDEGRKIEPTEVVEDVISLNSYSGSPMQLATQEWYEFEQNYDTDKALLYEVGNTPNPHGISDDYWGIYGCYTWEMVEKVDEIAQKYDLRLLSRDTLVQTYQNHILFEALGIDSVCKPDTPADITNCAGTFYQNGNFALNVDFSLTDSSWESEIWGNFYYSQKGYFDPSYYTIEANAYEQWNYTTADGTQLLLALKDSHAFIFAETADAMITVSLNLDTSLSFPYEEGKPVPDKTVVEQAAEIFDYSIQPHSVTDYEAIEAKLAEAEAQWEASRAVEPVEFYSFGEYLLNDFWIDDRYYVLMDFDGDGNDDLLLGDGTGQFNDVLHMQNGTVQTYMYSQIRLCENGIVEGSNISEEYSLEEYQYYKYGGEELQLVENITCRDGVWEHYDVSTESSKTITSEEANAIRAKYTYADLEWKPALDYPVEGRNKTVGQILREQDVILTQDQRRELFARTAIKDRSIFPRKYYTFMDINGDGEEELLLGADEDSFNHIYIIRHNRAHAMYQATSYLYDGNVIARFGDGIDYDNGWYKQYVYSMLNGTEWTELDNLYYWQGTDSWSTSRTGGDITEAAANAIMSKYTPAELNMKPLSEWRDLYGLE